MKIVYTEKVRGYRKPVKYDALLEDAVLSDLTSSHSEGTIERLTEEIQTLQRTVSILAQMIFDGGVKPHTVERIISEPYKVEEAE